MEIIKLIKDTPVPVLLILVGLLILVLAFVTRIGGVIEVSTEQRRWAIPIGLLILVIGLIINFYTPATPMKKPPSNQEVADTFDPTKPYLIQLGSDTNPLSAGDEIDRVRDLAKEQKLSIIPFKKGNWYVTAIGFFETKDDAKAFQNFVIREIPFFQSTNPQVQNIREWCPAHQRTGVYLECNNEF